MQSRCAFVNLDGFAVDQNLGGESSVEVSKMYRKSP